MGPHVEFQLLGEGLPLDAHATSYRVTEALSEPYRIELELVTADATFQPERVLRTGLGLRLVDAPHARFRLLRGVCDVCELLHHDGTHFVYRLELRPAFFALSRREDCRIYQELSAVDVVKQVLAAAGVDATEWRLTGTYPVREYVVQYRESDAAFVSRLLEDEGIYYFFEHHEEGATMVFGDAPRTIAEDPEFPVVLTMVQGLGGTDPVSDLRLVRRLRTSSVRVRDFDFERPQRKPDGAQPADSAWPMPVYEYPGGFVEDDDAVRKAGVRLRALRADHLVVRGSSRASVLEVGKAFTIAGAAQAALDGRFSVTKLVSSGRQSLTGRGDGEATLENTFEAVPEGTAWAPPKRTPRPRIHGLQPAIVTGPEQGPEQIHVDAYGRVKVRFFWDRVGHYDDHSSCWIRVTQAPLGGAIVLPRVGWEVAVAFLGGDPDRPLVQSRVYNAERTLPVALPGAKAAGSLKTSSSPGGAGHNTLSFDDSGGLQGLNLHAQKDLNVTIEHDQNETVGVNDTRSIKVNAKHNIGSNQATTIGGNQSLNVGSIANAKVTGDLTVTVGGNATDDATSNFVENVGGNRGYTVGGNRMVVCNGVEHNVGASLTRTVGTAELDASVASIKTTVGTNGTDTIGAVAIDLCKGDWAETAGANITCTYAVADIHLVKGSWTQSSGVSTTHLTGGLHYQKIAGEYSVSAPMITLLGAMGTFKGGGSELKLGGGPVLAKGSKIASTAALMVKMGTSLKLG